jgi:Sec-independent protein translocase protein TatA
LAIFLQLDSYEIRSSKSLYNIATGTTILVVMLFAKVYLFFVSTRMANIKESNKEIGKGYKKHYYDFLFLNKDQHCDDWYSKHHVILNLLKDPVIAFCLVFFSKIPYLQIGSTLVILFVFFLAEVTSKPLLKKTDNWRNIVSLGIYSVICVLFLILLSRQESMEMSKKEKYFGWPLIILVSALMVFNFGLTLPETYRNIKARIQSCKKKNVNQVEPEKAKETTDTAKNTLDKAGVAQGGVAASGSKSLKIMNQRN